MDAPQSFDRVSRSDYVARVRAAALARTRGEPLNIESVDSDLDALIRLLGTDDDQERLRDITESFLVDTTRGYVGLLVIVPLEHVHAALTSNHFQASNWHYDRRARCLLVNMRMGRHEHLSALLNRLYQGSLDDTEGSAERFIEDGLGWFKSSASFGRMLIGEGVRMDAQERAAFASVERL